MKKNKFITIQCLSFSDIGLALYTYFLLSNFSEFKRIMTNSAKLAHAEEILSPDFLLELFKVFLHTLTLISISLVVLHLIIYFFYFKEKKFAQLYVRYYSFLAAASLLLSAFYMKVYILLIPTVIYAIGFKYSEKVETKKKQIKTEV